MVNRCDIKQNLINTISQNRFQSLLRSANLKCHRSVYADVIN